MTGAMSSGTPILFEGWIFAINWSMCADFPSLKPSVSMTPGDIVFTVMSREPSSCDSVRATCSIAPFELACIR